MWTYLQVTPVHLAHLDTELVVEIGRDNSRSYIFPEKKRSSSSLIDIVREFLALRFSRDHSS